MLETTQDERQRKGARTLALKIKGWRTDGTFWRHKQYRMCVNNVMLLPEKDFRHSITHPEKVWPNIYKKT